MVGGMVLRIPCLFKSHFTHQKQHLETKQKQTLRWSFILFRYKKMGHTFIDVHHSLQECIKNCEIASYFVDATQIYSIVTQIDICSDLAVLEFGLLPPCCVASLRIVANLAPNQNS